VNAKSLFGKISISKAMLLDLESIDTADSQMSLVVDNGEEERGVEKHKIVIKKKKSKGIKKVKAEEEGCKNKKKRK
jgi:hypothetical protein